jgi:hypothetical protein
MRARPSFALLAVALIACHDSPTAPVPPAGFRSAPAIVQVAGQSLTLETFLWRDFQPSSPPDGKPLLVVVRVHAAGDIAVSDAVRFDGVWVVNGADVWGSKLDATPYASLVPYLEGTARNGPKWGPGIRVDVVVRLRDANGGAVLLRARDQLIARTD